MSLSDWADLATVVSAVGVVVAVAALFFSWRQLKLGAGNTRAQLWLELRRMFAEHEEVHFKLGLGGAYWKRQERGDCCGKVATWPCCKEQLFKLEAYMGLFEHCEALLEESLIDEGQFRDIYKYRVERIVANQKIRRFELERHASKWTRFLALLERFEIPLDGDSGDEHKGR